MVVNVNVDVLIEDVHADKLGIATVCLLPPSKCVPHDHQKCIQDEGV